MILTTKPISEIRSGLLLAVVLGMFAYGIKSVINYPAADSLLIALILGITVRSLIRKQSKFSSGLTFAPAVFIPVGIIFYGAKNLNFAKLVEVDKSIIFLLMVIIVVYFAVILLLGKWFGQRKQITYLTAAGSAICGASAIAITSPAVDAEPEDVSISLLAVAVAALLGFSLILPFFAAFLNISCETHCLASGSVLQFTGLVKVSNQFVPFLSKGMAPDKMVGMALSVKALRYLGLLIIIPLLASLIKNKFYVPWFLWAFLAAGLLGTWFYVKQNTFFTVTIGPYLSAIHTISWSIAMAAIGLNADIRQLLSNNGSKAIIMAFAGFLAATTTFFVGFYIIALL